MADVERLVGELLTRGDMNEDTVIDLNRILADSRAGSLHADDDTYLRALHARIFETPIADQTASIASEPDRLEGLTIADWRDRALRAEAQLADTQDTTRNN